MYVLHLKVITIAHDIKLYLHIQTGSRSYCDDLIYEYIEHAITTYRRAFT